MLWKAANGSNECAATLRLAAAHEVFAGAGHVHYVEKAAEQLLLLSDLRLECDTALANGKPERCMPPANLGAHPLPLSTPRPPVLNSCSLLSLRPSFPSAYKPPA